MFSVYAIIYEESVYIMRIDQDCLMRGLAHKFMVIRTPLIRKLLGIESDSALFYAWNGKLGELLFMPVAVKVDGELKRVEVFYTLTTASLDNCKGRIVRRKDVPKDLKLLAAKIELDNAVSKEREVMRTLGGFDPYRFRKHRDIIRIFDRSAGKIVTVIPTRYLKDRIMCRRVNVTDCGLLEVGEEEPLTIVEQLSHLEIYL